MNIDIEPASTEQVIKAGDDWIVIEQDVGEVAKELKEIDPCLHVRNNPVVGIYAVFAKEGNAEHLVFTAKSLDKRMCNRIRQIMSSDYDYSKELQKNLDKHNKEWEYRHSQKIEEKAERLAWTIRKELGLNKDKIFVA
jgi:hypothetical protein